MATIGPWPAFPVSAAASDSAPAPSAMTRALFGHEPHRLPRFLEGDDNGAVDHRLHSFPHAREDALAAGAVDERRLPGLELLRRAAASESAIGAAVSGSTPQIVTPGAERLERAADAGDESAAADARDHGRGLGRVLQNLQPHRGVTGDEIVIVERMNERSLEHRETHVS